MCPSCEEVNSYGVNLVAILAGLKSGDYESEFDVRDFKIKFRPLSFKELNEAGLKQFELQKAIIGIEAIEDLEQRDKAGFQALESITMMTMQLIGSSVEYIKTDTLMVTEQEFILDFLKNCDRNIYNAIRDHHTALKDATEIKPLDIKCPSCENEYAQSFTLNPADFFA
jgi:bacterioferritin-associated ferredoxin